MCPVGGDIRPLPAGTRLPIRRRRCGRAGIAAWRISSATSLGDREAPEKQGTDQAADGNEEQIFVGKHIGHAATLPSTRISMQANNEAEHAGRPLCRTRN